jgi:hypothetical protein
MAMGDAKQFSETGKQIKVTAKVAAKLNTDPLTKVRIDRGAAMIEALLHGGDMKAVKEAADAIRGLTPERGGLGDIPGSTLGGGSNDRRIGGVPGAKNNDTLGGDTGFDDPLAGHRNRRSGSVVVGAPGMPDKGGLTRQDGGYGTDGGTSYSSGSDGYSPNRGYVWVERNTERTSTDGLRTWGSTAYRDYSGNHWRVDYTETRSADGESYTTKETIFDAHNEPVKTTVRETLPDGNARETTTSHATGEVSTVTAPFPKIFPGGYQPDEGGGGGDGVAPRGWYNPITGMAQNPGLKTNNNQVNPGRGESTQMPAPAEPLLLDPDDLVINPSPDTMTGTGGTPRDIRDGDPTIVDPPRPIL